MLGDNCHFVMSVNIHLLSSQEARDRKKTIAHSNLPVREREERKGGKATSREGKNVEEEGGSENAGASQAGTNSGS